MANLLNTQITGKEFATPPVANTSLRPGFTTTTVRWTTSGYTVLTGNTPTASSTSWTAPAGVTSVEVLVVAGGGGGSNDHGGGGGGGGVVYNSVYPVTPGQAYTVTVGAGGNGGGIYRSDGRGLGTNGSNSIFGALTAIGGGYSGSYSNGGANSGGSGGGGSNGGAGGAGTAGQGYPGGSSITGSAPDYHGAGGGGAGGPGGNVGSISYTGGGGGNGLAFDISGTLTYYGGGGGGCSGYSTNGNYGAGGLGGGGKGAQNSVPAESGTNGLGGGGGGANRFAAAGNHAAGSIAAGGAGGSGVVIIRYIEAAIALSGSLRYNTDLTGLEVYENDIDQWTSVDETKNFGGHNLVSYSEQINQWSTGAGVTVTADNVLSPTGFLTADRIVYSGAGSGGGLRFYTTAPLPVAATSRVIYTASIWLRADAPTTVRLYGNGAGAAGDMVTCNLTTTWQRFSTTGTGGNGASAVQLLIYSPDGINSAFTIYAWGGQIVEGNTAGIYTRTAGAPSPVPGVQGDYRIHKYTTTGTSSFVPACSGVVEVLVVAGGGGASSSIYGQGGAGGGGVIYNRTYAVTSGKTYDVVVGAGGTAGNNGSNSKFGSLVAIGGGTTGSAGGCGGGGGHSNPGHPGGCNTVGQGFAGGYHVYSSPYPCGGGGGAGGLGFDGSVAGGAGAGGPGFPCDITGSLTYYAGGGGGTQYNNAGVTAGGVGGVGGGGNGVWAGTGVAGLPNTGGGGGAGGGNGTAGAGGAGGSGIVVVRYRYN